MQLESFHTYQRHEPHIDLADNGSLLLRCVLEAFVLFHKVEGHIGVPNLGIRRLKTSPSPYEMRDDGATASTAEDQKKKRQIYQLGSHDRIN